MPSNELTEIAGTAARGGLYLFVGNLATTVILAVGSIIIARLLGASNYGLYILTLLVPILVVSLTDVGINYALVRMPAKLRSEGDLQGASKTIRLGFLFKIFVSIVAFLVCYIGAEPIAATVLNRVELAPLLRLTSILILFQPVLDAVSSSFNSLDLMQYTSGIQVLYSILKGALGPALVLVGFGIAGAIGGYVIGVAAAAIVGATILFTRHARPSFSEKVGSEPVRLAALVGYGLPLYLATLITAFLTQYQNIVMARFATNVEIGNFNAAWNFNSLLVILLYPFTTAMFPMFSKMDQVNSQGDLARALELAVKYASLLMIPAAVGVMVFSRDLVYLTYGEGYALAPRYLILVSALYFLTGVGYQILGTFLSGVAETRTVLFMGMITLGVYLPLGFVFARLWGPYGLLVAFFLSTFTSTMYGLRVALRRYHARLDLKSSAKIASAAMIAAAPPMILILLHVTVPGAINLIVGAALFLLTYLTVAPAVRALGKSDIDNLDVTLCRTRIAAIFLRPVLKYERMLLPERR
jgi:stage V sporulation protein B